MVYAYDGGFAAGGATLSVNGQPWRGPFPHRGRDLFHEWGTFDVATREAVGAYPHDFPFNGRIDGITLERLEEPMPAVKAENGSGPLPPA